MVLKILCVTEKVTLLLVTCYFLIMTIEFIVVTFIVTFFELIQY